ncbi:MAG: hypothetical protein CL843_01090 [Crocinitomicaceae bacterium]|nr:hypothetical protein [Crocinitomicaceae bacterium]|tara:strand:+ start:373 stop:588 length:216 start_codon:yes stop_codon:yes gene_type:complete
MGQLKASTLLEVLFAMFIIGLAMLLIYWSLSFTYQVRHPLRESLGPGYHEEIDPTFLQSDSNVVLFIPNEN